VVDLVMTGCAVGTPAVIEPEISDFMLDQLTALDAEMENACR